jgi:hypothetical protein
MSELYVGPLAPPATHLLLVKTQQDVSLQFFSVNLPQAVFKVLLEPLYDSQKELAPVAKFSVPGCIPSVPG